MKQIITIIISLLLSVTSAAAQDWKAQWITSATHSEQANSWYCFHKSITLPDISTSEIEARIAVDSKYWLWINGDMVVFEGGLKRGPTPNDTYYDSVNIAPYLHSGENTIALLVWYFGKHGFAHNSSGKAGLIFDCQAENFEILSDESWLCQHYEAYEHTGEPHPNYRLSESNIRFNAQKEVVGWFDIGSHPSFPNAVALGKAGIAPWNQLIERPIPQWRDFGFSDYVSIEKQSREDVDIYYCRLPYNCHATPYLDVEAEAGKVIHIETDNYWGGSEANVRAEYVTRNGVQQYESLGWMNGHTMIYRIPKGMKVNALRYRETGYDTDFDGKFNCDDDFLNRLREKALRTLYVTMRDTYMDCPDRERSQWWGDEVNELGEAFYATDLEGHKLARKGILELVNWQRNDGVLFSPCPSGVWRNELPAQMLASVGYYGFYTYYLYSGDESIIPLVYEPVKRYLHEVWRLDDEGLLVMRHGDWPWGDWGENIDLDLLLNCWYYLALKGEKEFATILHKSEDVAHIESIMRGMEASFNRRFWNGKEYRSPLYNGTTDDRGQAMAILAGFAGKEQYPLLREVLRREQHASPYMEKYVGEALFAMGYAEDALQRTRKRFATMVNNEEYTTLWEGWGIGKEGYGGGTTNHAWSGGTLTLLSQYVAGIAPTEAGFKQFAIRPQMGDLNRVTAEVVTRYGAIKVDIERHKNKLHITFEVPEGTQASLMKRGKERIYGSGKHSVKLPIE